MSAPDTIVAPATPAGIASLSVIRLSGPQALGIALAITRKEELVPRYATLSRLFDAHGDLMDEAIVIYFQAPRSFTTEDVVEFQCHGGNVVAGMVLEACLYYGARMAHPGEFTKRALLGGRIDLAKAEAIANIIKSRSEDAAKVLARQLDGELSSFVDEIRGSLLSVLAYSEVSIDYADEDLPEDLLEQIAQKLDSVQQKLSQTLQASLSRQGLIEGYKLAIVGKPNVGKSSLLNRLLYKERAIVSDIEGTTRDTIEESLKIGTHLVRLVDTAGIRESDNAIEKIGIDRTLKAVDESDLLLLVLDSSREIDSQDEEIIQLVRERKQPGQVLVLLNKCDLPQKLKTDTLQEMETLSLSCQQDIQPLLIRLREILDQRGGAEELVLSSKRQIHAVQVALDALKLAIEQLVEQELELFSHHILESAHAIGAITAPVEKEELLDAMFSEFCLGK